MMTFRRKALPGLVLASLFAAGASQAVTLGTAEETTVTYGGFVKLDAIMSDYSDGDLSAGNLGRDFYVPSLTPVGGANESSHFDMHARQTRLNLGTSTMIDGVALKTFIEMDFMSSATNADERITNGYSPGVRHAFITYGNWLFGQTWSTFQNTNSLPDTVDFVGNTDFGIFVRQPQIRYSNGGWQFSIENPESTITPFGGGTRIVSDDNSLPDIVGRYNLTSGGLTMSFAILARQLNYDNGSNIDTKTSSTGISITGKAMLGKDDIRFGFNAGKGLGRYIGLNVVNGGVLDANGDLETIDSKAVYVAYRHLWNDKWRSTFTYSAIAIDNDVALTGASAIESTNSARVNFLYAATPKLTYGLELTRANKDLESNADGSMTRVQFMAKLDF